MIIIVKINKTYISGHDPKTYAAGQWVSAKLIDDPSERNKYRYLAAYANKKILGVYCIAGVGQVMNSKPRRVYFNLHDMNPECEASLMNLLQKLVDENYSGIVNQESICYLEQADLIIAEHLSNENKNCCPKDEIPLLEPKPWEKPNLEREHVQLPKNSLWYKMSVNYSSYDSFRTPVSINIQSIATLNPNGRIKYQRSDNSSGAMKISSTLLNRVEKTSLLHIFGVFENNPKTVYNAIEYSHQSMHVAHVNSITITIESFSDAAHTKRLQHMTWNGNVIITHSGVLKTIFDIMVR